MDPLHFQSLHPALEAARRDSPERPVVREGLFEEADLFAQDLREFSFRDCSFVDADLRGAAFDPKKIVNCNFDGAQRGKLDHPIPGWTVVDGRLRNSSELNGEHPVSSSESALPASPLNLPPVNFRDLGNGIIRVMASEGLPMEPRELSARFAEELGARVVVYASNSGMGYASIWIADPEIDTVLGERIAQALESSGIDWWLLGLPTEPGSTFSPIEHGSELGVRVLADKEIEVREIILQLLDPDR